VQSKNVRRSKPQKAMAVDRILHSIWVSFEKSGKFTCALLASFEFSCASLLLPLQLLSRGAAGVPTPQEEVIWA
jgi:hypothetical protein